MAAARKNQPQSDESKDSADTPADQTGVEIAPNIYLAADRLQFTFSRSSGPGGQNVNKVNTRAELRIKLENLIKPIGPLQKFVAPRLRRLAGRRITKDDELILTCDTHRTQRQNRKECLERLRSLIIQAQHRPKPRKKTKPSRGAIERRLKQKRVRSTTKQNRRNPDKSDGD